MNKQEKRLKKLQEKEKRRQEQKIKKAINKFLKIFYVFLAVFGIGWAFYYFGSNAKVLPPTTTQGHSEMVPDSNILTSELPETVQKHMLEHAGGSGPGGTIIQYNCYKYECEDDLVKKLENIAKQYPKTVYLAPTSKYEGKIILTSFGKIKVLDEFDENQIKEFIER